MSRTMNRMAALAETATGNGWVVAHRVNEHGATYEPWTPETVIDPDGLIQILHPLADTMRGLLSSFAGAKETTVVDGVTLRQYRPSHRTPSDDPAWVEHEHYEVIRAASRSAFRISLFNGRLHCQPERGTHTTTLSNIEHECSERVPRSVAEVPVVRALLKAERDIRAHTATADGFKSQLDRANARIQDAVEAARVARDSLARIDAETGEGA